ncbi:MAG: MFS transporter, partial [Sciscionella sp.]
MTDAHAAETAIAPDEKTVRRAVAASAMGNAIEWFDYGVLTAGVMTPIVGSVLFPPGSESDAIRNTFLLLAVSFIPRPFGGAFFGMLGDKIGRRKVLATTILLMSGCTFLIGLLPSYASIGILAPILLLLIRLIQGFSTGGEYGGAATFIAEYAPTRKRGFLGAFLEFGTLAGFVFGAALVLVVNLIVGDAAMSDWCWRIPFMVALPLGLVGLYLRSRLEDTPVFRELLEKAPPRKSKL